MSKSKMLINIRGLEDIIDPSYRYKMEHINTTQQKGKIIITNINDIAKNLTVQNVKEHNDKSKMIIEFLKKKFSVAIKCDKELTKVELKGVTEEELQIAIYEFIEYFVICPICRNPETILSKKNSNLYITCQACSYHDKIKDNNKIITRVWDSFLKIL